MSPARSPPGTLCFDIFSAPPGDSDVTIQRDRLSSNETKIAPRSVRIAAGMMIAGEGLFMAVSCADGCLSNPTLPERRSRSTAHGILNPLFVEALMGWPTGWTGFASVATAWFRWLRRMRCDLSQLNCWPVDEVAT